MMHDDKPNGSVKILCEYKILYDGWEMDNTGWVVSDENGDIWLKETSHGSAFFMRGEDAVASLNKTIKQHYDAMEDQRTALSILVQS